MKISEIVDVVVETYSFIRDSSLSIDRNDDASGSFDGIMDGVDDGHVMRSPQPPAADLAEIKHY